MLFLTALPHFPGAWIQDAALGAALQQRGMFNPLCAMAEDVQEPQTGGVTIADRILCCPSIHSFPDQSHHHQGVR